ncbi:MAG: MerR family transcriptional regulator [Anaerolineae bacterium]
MYTVKQLSEMAQVSIRTLHYYDEIDLLRPSHVGANGYRYYDDEALLRLQQILFYREMGLELLHIKDLLDDPEFDVVAALQSHRTVLEAKREHLRALISTIDDTITHLTEGKPMSKKALFKPFSEKEQKHYERLARLEYGPTYVNESVKRWAGYSKAQKQAILDEASEIYRDVVAAIEKKRPANSPEVQAILVRWEKNLHHFYDPPLEMLRGLGETYRTHPGFIESLGKIHPDLPEYMGEAVAVFVDALETAAIEGMIADDEHGRLAE